MIYSYLMTIIVLILFKVLWDSYARREGRVINHYLSASLDTGLYFLFAVFIYVLHNHEYNFMMFTLMTLTALIFRWMLFDLVFNIFNYGASEWNFYGTSSVIDKKCNFLGGYACLFIKIVLICLVTHLIFNNYNYW